MIKFDLICECGKTFESWFASSKEFASLSKKKIVRCINCNSTSVKKSIMSPNIASKEKNIEKKFNNEEFDKIKRELIKIRKFVEKNFEFVGDKFPKEARDIYYDNKKNKNIYGTATPEEKLELEEEGIELASIPWVNNKKEN